MGIGLRHLLLTHILIDIFVYSSHLSDSVSVQKFTLDEQISVLKRQLKKSMDKYSRLLVSQSGVPEDTAQGLALKARFEPRDNPHCKRIFQDHQELVEKQSQMDRCSS